MAEVISSTDPEVAWALHITFPNLGTEEIEKVIWSLTTESKRRIRYLIDDGLPEAFKQVTWMRVMIPATAIDRVRQIVLGDKGN